MSEESGNKNNKCSNAQECYKKYLEQLFHYKL